MSTQIMEIEDDLPLRNWKENTFLKNACRHLNEQPEYEVMAPDEKAALTSFGHALRRALMWVNEAPACDRLGRILDLKQTYDLHVVTRNYLLYHAEVYGYRFTVILGLSESLG